MRILFLLMIIWCSSINVSKACKCDEEFSAENAYRRADAVIIGKIISKTIVNIAETINPTELALLEQDLKEDRKKLLLHPMVVKVEIQVTQALKGQVNKKVIIFTPIGSASCGYTLFDIGKSFRIYGVQNNFFAQLFFKNKGLEKAGTYWTHRCSGTHKIV